MTFARRLTRIIDIFYLPPLRRLVPLQTFRYAVCGGANMGFDLLLISFFTISCWIRRASCISATLSPFRRITPPG